MNNFYFILVLHFVADFVLQGRTIARNKSSSIKHMSAHCAIYTAVLCLAGIRFGLINGGLHFITDSVSSRLTSKFWRSGRDYLFWLVIGADQLVHTVTLYVFYTGRM